LEAYLYRFEVVKRNDVDCDVEKKSVEREKYF
jgi:hypothetical protein